MRSSLTRLEPLPSENPEVSSALILTGQDFDPSDITDRLGLEPTTKWRAGDQIGKSLLRRKHTGWLLRRGPEFRFDLDQQLRELLDSISPATPKLLELSSRLRLDVEISCVAYVDDTAPSFHLTKDDLGQIRTMGAEVDLDVIRTEILEGRWRPTRRRKRLPKRDWFSTAAEA